MNGIVTDRHVDVDVVGQDKINRSLHIVAPVVCKLAWVVVGIADGLLS